MNSGEEWVSSSISSVFTIAFHLHAIAQNFPCWWYIARELFAITTVIPPSPISRSCACLTTYAFTWSHSLCRHQVFPSIYSWLPPSCTSILWIGRDKWEGLDNVEQDWYERFRKGEEKEYTEWGEWEMGEVSSAPFVTPPPSPILSPSIHSFRPADKSIATNSSSKVSHPSFLWPIDDVIDRCTLDLHLLFSSRQQSPSQYSLCSLR